jgi:hypothetical protein
MCHMPEQRIRHAAATAQSLLGQLGPLAWALHVVRQAAGAFAVCVDAEPETYVEIRTDETQPARSERKASVVAALRSLRQHRGESRAHLFGSRGYRETINRSIVVYAVAVLESFLDAAARPLWEERAASPRMCPRGCWRDPEWPADALNKIKCLQRNAGVDLRLAGQLYVNTGWLVLVRNAIIHSDGRAQRAGHESSRYGLRGRKAPAPWRRDEGTDGDGRPVPVLVWDEASTTRPDDDWRDRRFSIAVDHFILPRLRDVQAFVEEAADTLCRHSRATNANGDSAQQACAAPAHAAVTEPDGDGAARAEES